MLSPRRVSVAGSMACVAFYELLEFSADLSDHAKTSIALKWFTAYENTMNDEAYFTPKAYYYGWDRAPTLKLIQDHKWAYIIQFPELGDPTEETTKAELPPMSLNKSEVDRFSTASIVVHCGGTNRNLWMFKGNRVVSFEPIAFDGSWGLEGRGVDISPDDLRDVRGFISFDEDSDLVCWMQKTE